MVVLLRADDHRRLAGRARSSPSRRTPRSARFPARCWRRHPSTVRPASSGSGSWSSRTCAASCWSCSCSRSSGTCASSPRSTPCRAAADSPSETNVLGTYMFRQGPGDFGVHVRHRRRHGGPAARPVVGIRALDAEGGGAVSTQINASTQLGTIGVDEVLGDGGEPKAPQAPLDRSAASVRQAGRHPHVPERRGVHRLLLLGLPGLLDGEHVVHSEQRDHQPHPQPLARSNSRSRTTSPRGRARPRPGQTGLPARACMTSVDRHGGRAGRDAAVRLPRFGRGRALPLQGPPRLHHLGADHPDDPRRGHDVHDLRDDRRLAPDEHHARPRHRVHRYRDPVHDLDAARIRRGRSGRPRGGGDDRRLHEARRRSGGSPSRCSHPGSSPPASSPSSRPGTSSRSRCC